MAPTAATQSTPPNVAEPAVPDNTDAKQVQADYGSNFLITKMVDVLRNMGYDESAVEKVASRAEANTIEASNLIADGSLIDDDSLSLIIERELLNEPKLRQREVYLNSNEPVLLLQASKEIGLESPQIHELKENLLHILRRKGIKPVRVYIRQTGPLEQSNATVMLLNVVNTDIGGPSMVQLLDAAFHGEEWKEELVVKEAWDGYDLLWKDEAWADGAADAEQEVVEKPSEEQQADDAGVAGEAPAIAQPKEDQGAQVNEAQYKDVDAVPEEEEDIEPEPVEHPAMKELREREAQRSGVQHPTWSRGQDDPGLVDIITTHSSAAGDTDPVSIIAGRTKEPSDDEFEVVEKT